MPKTKQHPSDRRRYINTRMNEHIYKNYTDRDTYKNTPDLERVRWGDPKKGEPRMEKNGKPVRYVHDRDTVSQKFKSRKV